MDVVDLAIKLIKTPSVTGSEDKIANVIAELMKEAGLNTKIDEVGNVIGTTGKGSPKLLFNGHMDTVPSYFEPSRDDDRIHGRGSVDMKGGLAAMLKAIESVKNRSLKGTLIFSAVVDEERDSQGTYHLLGSVDADFAVVGEPTNLDIVIGHKGRVEFEITTHGKAAHASRPQEGINAISDMAKIVHAMDHMEFKEDDVLGRGTLTVGCIKGGSSPNVVPDFCKIIAERRLTIGEEPEDAKNEIYKVVESLDLKSNFQIKFKKRKTPFLKPFLISKDQKIVKIADCVLRETLGKSKIRTVDFVTDASYLNEKFPTIVLGPGDAKKAHTKDEFVKVDELEDAVSVYKKIIEECLIKNF